MTASDPQWFTHALRDATRQVHTLSDALVNVKLGVACADEAVWAEGLLVFYPIFRFLEAALVRQQDSLLGDLLLDEMSRTDKFERDLTHFYRGARAWQKRELRPAVRQYLKHLETLEEERPYALLAYVYHLYMGLFSGGQILQAKRSLLRPGDDGGDADADADDLAGRAVTHFGAKTASALKRELRRVTNDVADNLDEDTRRDILRESVHVFEWNNRIIRTVRGVDDIFYRKLAWLVVILLVVAVVLKWIIF